MTAQEETKLAQMQCAYEDKIKELEAELKAAQDHAAIMEACAEAELANSVPFEVLQEKCRKDGTKSGVACHYDKEEMLGIPTNVFCAKESCPLIAKPEKE